MNTHKLLKSLFLILIIQSQLVYSELVSLFGSEENPSELVAELLKSPAMMRLQHIDQSGITHYTNNLPSFTRYDHSVGVYLLLKRFGASEKECLAGLLHDTSHTVFSHVGDFLFNGEDGEYSYQDSIHLWYLEKQGIPNIINKYNLSLQDVDAKRPEYNMLEQNLPQMCADRIEYNLHTAYLWGLICSCEIDTILNDLRYEDPYWYFTNDESAKSFAEFSLYFTETLWGSPMDLLSYYWCAEALKVALKNNVVESNEIIFGMDTNVLAKLESTDDVNIKEFMQNCKQPLVDMIEVDTGENYDIFIKAKFRGIDPMVMVDGKLFPLTVIDQDFADKYYSLKTKIEKGFYFKKVESQKLVVNL